MNNKTNTKTKKEPLTEAKQVRVETGHHKLKALQPWQRGMLAWAVEEDFELHVHEKMEAMLTDDTDGIVIANDIAIADKEPCKDR